MRWLWLIVWLPVMASAQWDGPTNTPSVTVPTPATPSVATPSVIVPQAAFPQVPSATNPPTDTVSRPRFLTPPNVLPNPQAQMSPLRPIAPPPFPKAVPAEDVAAAASAAPALNVLPATKGIMFNTTEADEILSTLKVFPDDNPWKRVVSMAPLHPNSRGIVAAIGDNKPLRYNPDMAFILVQPNQQRVPVKVVGYPDESDPGPYPVPDNIPIEGWPVYYAGKNITLEDQQRDTQKEGGDRHAIVVDPFNRMLYEFYQMRRTDTGWQAAQASIFDLKTNKLRPAGWTSADAAGLPIFPAVVRYDELKRGRIDHALRVTVRRTQRAFVPPATHFASRLTDANLPRMGERLRLRQDFDVARFSPEIRTILTALKEYGMFVADNGIEWAISVAPDERIPSLHDELRQVKGSDFEVVGSAF